MNISSFRLSCSCVVIIQLKELSITFNEVLDSLLAVSNHLFFIVGKVYHECTDLTFIFENKSILDGECLVESINCTLLHGQVCSSWCGIGGFQIFNLIPLPLEFLAMMFQDIFKGKSNNGIT